MPMPIGALILVPLLVSGAALAQQQEQGIDDKAERVARQPLKDVGALKEKIPPELLEAREDPYKLDGIRGCKAYQERITKLNEILGPDIDDVDDKGNPLPGRLAEQGALSVVNALIPFRGLVREATGAAENDRRVQAAYLAGSIRRGFLKGYAKGRGCRI